MRILAVDDSPQVRDFLVTRFSAPDTEIITARDGVEALETAFQRLPDMILLDVMMPGMNGFEVCRRLRQDPRTRSIPIILLTVKTERDDQLNGLRSGADFYILKPIDANWLWSKINLFRTQYRKPLNWAA